MAPHRYYPGSRSAAIDAMYAERPSTREKSRRERHQSPRLAHRTDTPDSGFFDDDNEGDYVSRPRHNHMAARRAAPPEQRQQHASRVQAEHITQVQPAEDAELTQALAASMITAQQAERAQQEQEETQHAMIQSAIEQGELARRLAEDEDMFEAIRQSQIEEGIVARRREEEEELQRVLVQSTLEAEEQELQYAEASKSEMRDHQLFVEAQRFRGSKERNQAAASRTRRLTVFKKESTLSAMSEPTHKLPGSMSRAAYSSQLRNESKRKRVCDSLEMSEGDASKLRTPAVPPKNVMPNAVSEETPTESQGIMPAATPFAGSQHGHEARDPASDLQGSPEQGPKSITEILLPGNFKVREELGDANYIAARQSTPLPAPQLRREHRPEWLTKVSISHVSAPESRPPVSPHPRRTDAPNQATGFALQSDLPKSSPSSNCMASSSNKPAVNDIVRAGTEPSEYSTPTIAAAQPQNHIHTYKAPVTVMNNSFSIVIPVEKVDNSLHRRTIVKNWRRMLRSKGSVSAAKASMSKQAENMVSQIRSGLESMNLGSGPYVTAADMNRRVIDEGYDSPTGAESPDPNLLAGLQAADARLDTAAQQSYQQSRSDENGSPVSFHQAPLRLVTARTPSPTPSPGRRPVPSRTSSPLYEDPTNVHDARNALPAQDQGLGTHGVNHETLTRSSTPPELRFTQNELLSHRLLAAPYEPSPLPPSYLCQPSPDAPMAATDSSLYEQYPVPIPDADRRADTPSSMRAENDSPTYQKRTLIRQHNPARVTDWANVPAPHDNLAYVNSRPMMDVDRFGHGSRIEMPTLPACAGEKKVAQRKVSPDTRAREAEKEMQKSMRSKM